MDIFTTKVKLLLSQSLQEQQNYLQYEVRQVHKLRDVNLRQCEEEDKTEEIMQVVVVTVFDGDELQLQQLPKATRTVQCVVVNDDLQGNPAEERVECNIPGRPKMLLAEHLLEVKLHSHMFPTSSAP